MNIKNFVPLFNGKNIPDTVKQITISIGQLWRELILTSNTIKAINKYLKDSIDLGFVKKKLGELDEVKLENPVDYIQFNTDYTAIHNEGSVHWNGDDGVLEYDLPGGNVHNQIGMELLMPRRMKNNSGVDIKNGQPVRTNGGSWPHIYIALAQADTFINSKMSGLATEDIDDGAWGWVCPFGVVRGDSDQPIDTSSYSVGTALHLSASIAGEFVTTPPDAPNQTVFIGRVWRSHAVEGEILVRPISTPELSKLSDVYGGGSETDYCITYWNDGNSRWEMTNTPKFGDVSGGDYTEFESDGTIKMVGDATVWEDLNFDVVRSGGPVAFRPDDVTINNLYYKEFTSSNNQTCGAEEEVPHNALLGGDFYPHAHGFLKSGESAGTTGITIRIYWELRQSTGTTNGSVDISKTSAEISANANKIDFYDSSFTGPTELGAQLAMRLDRIGGDCGDFIFTTYGIHYEKDTIGSRTVTSK